MKRMTIVTTLLTLACCLLLATAAQAAPAQKVKVCHIPPGNPSNFHTITISDNALAAHLGHGDLAGSCSQYCDTLCSDGDPCTIDACDANEHCLLDHPPVDCNDSNLCTLDSCDPANGCVYAPIVCDDGDNCTVDACDPLTGFCVMPAVECPEGQDCDADTGECTENPCAPNPCVNGGECADVGGVAVCSCPPGWTGTYCEIDIDECASNPCVNGLCSDQINAYVCSCDPGWTGTNCDVEAVSTYNCTDRNPCTEENTQGGQFYFAADDPNQFIQCDEFGHCYVMSCPPGLVWDHDALTCVFP